MLIHSHINGMVDLSIVFCKRLPGRVHWVPTASWKLATSVQRIWNHDFFTPLMAIIPWNPAKQTGKQWKTPPRPLAWTMPAISSYIQLCQLCHTVKEWTARDLLTWKCEKKWHATGPAASTDIHWPLVSLRLRPFQKIIFRETGLLGPLWIQEVAKWLILINATELTSGWVSFSALPFFFKKKQTTQMMHGLIYIYITLFKMHVYVYIYI